MNQNEDHLIAQFENELRSLRPLPADPDFMVRLERRMNGPITTPLEGTKIVPFPQTSGSNSNRVPLKPWAAVAACAAVATGAVMWNQSRLANQANVAFVPTPKPKNSPYVQQSSNSRFQGVHEAGMVVDPTKGPMRRLRVEFNNQQQFLDTSNGSLFEIIIPSTEEVLIPEPVH